MIVCSKSVFVVWSTVKTGSGATVPRGQRFAKSRQRHKQTTASVLCCARADVQHTHGRAPKDGINLANSSTNRMALYIVYASPFTFTFTGVFQRRLQHQLPVLSRFTAPKKYSSPL